MCESVADRRPRPARGRRARARPQASQRSEDRPAVVDGDPAPAWLAELPGVEAVRRDGAGAELELLPGADPAAILSGVLARGTTVSRFEIAEPSLEALFIEHVGHPADDDTTLAPDVAPALPVGGAA